MFVSYFIIVNNVLYLWIYIFYDESYSSYYNYIHNNLYIVIICSVVSINYIAINIVIFIVLFNIYSGYVSTSLLPGGRI